MAALDGAPMASRDAASFVVNVDNGGTAGRITVVPKQGADTAESEALYEQLQTSSASFATATHSETAVGGTGANLIDYKNTGLDKLPIVIGALALLTLVLLAIVTRSVLVPVASVVLSALTATASFGVLWLLFGGADPVLGGPGAIDPVTMIAVSTVIFGLAIQYEVFAVEHLHRVYGAGIAMLGVLLAFIPAQLTLISQFAIGMAVAVILDTLVVRPIMVRIDRRRRPEGPPEPGAPMPKPHLQGPTIQVRRPHMPHVHLSAGTEGLTGRSRRGPPRGGPRRVARRLRRLVLALEPLAAALHGCDELREVDLEGVEDLVGVVLGAEADLALAGAGVLDDVLGGALGLLGDLFLADQLRSGARAPP